MNPYVVVFDTNILFVTGDRHLLLLSQYQGIAIVSAADFLALVSHP